MNEDRYEDIISLPHPDSARHPRMPRRERAAQFAPFAALTGFGEMIDAAADGHAETMENPISWIPEDGQ